MLAVKLVADLCRILENLLEKMICYFQIISAWCKINYDYKCKY